MIIIDGKKLAGEILEELKKESALIPKKIRLAAVLVGGDSASLSFLKQKEKTARKIGLDFRLYQYPENITTKELRKRIGEICRVTYNRGVVVQLPLPDHLNIPAVLNAVLPYKDPDILCERNLGAFYTGRLKILPPVVAAIRFLIEKYQLEIKGREVLILGKGRLVGKPAALWFINQGATVTVASSQTLNLNDLCQRADIIVSGVGKANLITGKIIKKGVIIFDAGIVTEEGKLKGDCDFESIKEKASFITPVPNGLGPLTVALLFKNLLFLVREK